MCVDFLVRMACECVGISDRSSSLRIDSFMALSSTKLPKCIRMSYESLMNVWPFLFDPSYMFTISCLSHPLDCLHVCEFPVPSLKNVLRESYECVGVSIPSSFLRIHNFMAFPSTKLLTYV